jgi:alpha-glucoside transport system permease protein
MTALNPAAHGIPESEDLIPKASKAPKAKKSMEGSIAVRKKSVWATIIAALIAILWTIPTLGLLITSFRPQIDAIKSGWWTVWQDPNFTLDNYKEALTGGTTNLSSYFLNSFIITIPAVVIPISIACLTAYGFAWVKFKLAPLLFIAVFALQIVPIQVTMIPLLTLFVNAGLAGTFWPIWIAHSIFALPLAVYLLHNFMSELPKELFEAARVDGAGHLTIFFKILLPLMLPAIAAFAIFQFLWVWNDLLVGLTFGASPEVAPLTVRIAELSGTRGSAWHLLSAGAFISMVVPLIVFISMQRYFVRGLLAGSVKG